MNGLLLTISEPPAGLAFVDVPGCGKGYRAITTISRGSLILEEIPCIILQPGENTTQRINTLFNQLTTTQQQYFATLAISPPFLTDALDLNRKRFLTNALPCGRRAGLFLIAARFNSSCRPNMHYYWNETRSTMEFRAMRDIAPLEEVCIAYDPKSLLQPRVMRQEIIRRTSGFHCSCPACIPSLKGYVCVLLLSISLIFLYRDLAGQDRQTFSDNTRNWLRSVILPPTPPTMSSPLNSIRTVSPPKSFDPDRDPNGEFSIDI